MHHPSSQANRFELMNPPQHQGQLGSASGFGAQGGARDLHRPGGQRARHRRAAQPERQPEGGRRDQPESVGAEGVHPLHGPVVRARALPPVQADACAPRLLRGRGHHHGAHRHRVADERLCGVQCEHAAVCGPGAPHGAEGSQGQGRGLPAARDG